MRFGHYAFTYVNGHEAILVVGDTGDYPDREPWEVSIKLSLSDHEHKARLDLLREIHNRRSFTSLETIPF